jgi:hypothetical protein
MTNNTWKGAGISCFGKQPAAQENIRSDEFDRTKMARMV